MKIVHGLAALLAAALVGGATAQAQVVRPQRAPSSAVQRVNAVKRQPAPAPPTPEQPAPLGAGALPPVTSYPVPAYNGPVQGAPTYEGVVQEGAPAYGNGQYGGDVEYVGGGYGGAEGYDGGEAGGFVGGGPLPPVTPSTIRSSTVPTLDYNYYYPAPGSGYQAARLYLSPRPVPGHVGYTYITYQPFAPHEQLYAHRKAYYQFYPGGLTRTTVKWSSGCHHLLW